MSDSQKIALIQMLLTMNSDQISKLADYANLLIGSSIQEVKKDEVKKVSKKVIKKEVDDEKEEEKSVDKKVFVKQPLEKFPTVSKEVFCPNGLKISINNINNILSATLQDEQNNCGYYTVEFNKPSTFASLKSKMTLKHSMGYNFGKTFKYIPFASHVLITNVDAKIAMEIEYSKIFSSYETTEKSGVNDPTKEIIISN